MARPDNESGETPHHNKTHSRDATRPRSPRSPGSPRPPRYVWLKRLTFAVLLLLVALCMLRGWWGREADKRLAAEIDRIKARGEPLFLEDFAVAPVPDEENAAKALMDALAMWDDTNALIDDRQYLAENAEALALVRQAHARPGCDWGATWTSPPMGIHLPNFSQQRQLALKLIDVADRQHQLGDPVEAVHTLRDILHQGDVLDRPPTLLVHHQMAASIQHLARDHLVKRLPTMPNTPTVRQELASFRDRLLDERAIRRGHVRGWRGERVQMTNMGEFLLRGELSLTGLMTGAGAGRIEKVSVRLFAPLYKLDMVHMMRRYDRHVQAADTVRWDDYLRLRPEPLRPEWIERMRHPLMFVLEPAGNAAMRHHHHHLAHRRLTAAAIAIRLFQFDGGRRPESLK